MGFVDSCFFGVIKYWLNVFLDFCCEVIVGFGFDVYDVFVFDDVFVNIVS